MKAKGKLRVVAAGMGEQAGATESGGFDNPVFDLHDFDMMRNAAVEINHRFVKGLKYGRYIDEFDKGIRAVDKSLKRLVALNSGFKVAPPTGSQASKASEPPEPVSVELDAIDRLNKAIRKFLTALEETIARDKEKSNREPGRRPTKSTP